MHVSIRPIGNSRGIVIPKPMLAQLGLEDGADLTVENGALVIRKPAMPARAGWADAAKAVALAKDDGLVMGEFSNEGDEDLTW
ncbi:MAG: AbrB/MazE/SpoVT family DNA-binding domain-containing protein [Betaproteobacteria bacterium]